jgi:hypothetical protein
MPNKNYQRNTENHRTSGAVDTLNTNVAALTNVIMQLTDQVANNTKATQDTVKKTESKKLSPQQVAANKAAEKVTKKRESGEEKRAKGIEKIFEMLPRGFTKELGKGVQEKLTKSIVSATGANDKAKFKQFQDLRAQGVGQRDAMKASGIDTKALKAMRDPKNVMAGALSKGVGGFIQQAGQGLAGMAGGLLEAAGPIGAVAAVAKMAFDFWDSGGLAKVQAGMKMLSGNAMLGQQGVDDMKKSLEDTEEFRKIDAKYNYVKPIELKQEKEKELFDWEKEHAASMLKYNQSLVTDEIQYELSLRKDALQFGQNQAMQDLEARQEREKALHISGMDYIKGFNDLSERALKAIGTSTKEIIGMMGHVQSLFSATNEESQKIATNSALLAQSMGGSAEDTENIANLFRLMNKTSGIIGTNLIGGFEAMAKANGVTKASIFKQIAGASAEIYKFSGGTADNLVKQAISLTKMGVQMSAMAKASDAMVLNYKDSIKNEMQLSAMMGRNVDLSEARAKLMSGDMEGGAQAIKSALGDMDIASMNAFQKQALSQATGMDIASLMGLMQGKAGGAEGELTANEKAGQDIAKGALKQEIAQAGQKLGLEEAQRKQMLGFEQAQRLLMLQVEHRQKLAQIEVEALWRAKWEMEYAKKNEKELKAAEALAETKANALMLASQKQSIQQAFSAMGIKTEAGSTGDAAEKAMEGKIETLTSMVKGGFVNESSKEYQQYMVKQFDIMRDNAGKPEEMQKALENAFQTSFAKPMGEYTKAVTEANQRQLDIAKHIGEYGDIDSDYKAKMKISDDEVEAAKTKYMDSRDETKIMGAASTEQKTGKTLFSMKTNADTLMQQNTAAQVSGGAEGGVPAPNPEAQKAAVAAGTQPTVDVIAQQTEQAKINAQTQISVQKANNKIIESDAKVRVKADADAATMMYTQLNELLAMTGLSLEFLNDIAISNRTVTDVTLDGSRISSLLNETTRKSFGVVKVK